MSLTTAAPLLALLKEDDNSVKTYALQSINGVVDQLWSETVSYTHLDVYKRQEIHYPDDFENV